MNKKTMANHPSYSVADPAGDAPPHPLDEWLRRELEALYADDEDQPLPPGMAELADRLEQALAPSACKKKIPGAD
jgi:hypothetical protein